MAESDQAPPLSILSGAALFLDFDGTLVELAETPDAIEVPATLGPLIGRLHDRLEGRVAVITGRALADIERHLDCSAIAVSGSHGLELKLAAGKRTTLAAAADLDPFRREIAGFAAGRPGLLIENKPASIALHYRQVPDAEEEVGDFMAALAARSGLAVQHGKRVVELRPPGADKGDALQALMREPEFAGARPLFVGDDLTDESAFRAAAALGGGGILVGPVRDTAAGWRLESVAAVADWLGEAAAA